MKYMEHSNCVKGGEIKMNPIVSMEMNNGKNIKIELYPEIAPNTVKKFYIISK